MVHKYGQTCLQWIGDFGFWRERENRTIKILGLRFFDDLFELLMNTSLFHSNFSYSGLIWSMILTNLVNGMMQLHGACRVNEYKEVKRFKSLSASGGIWGECSVGRVIIEPMVTPSEAKTENIRTTHALSFLMTPKVLSKLQQAARSPKLQICKLHTLNNR